MSPSSLRHISIVFTGKVLAQSSQPVANFFLGKKCISWRLRAENSACDFTCQCDFSSQEQNCVSISIAKPGRQIFIEEKHTSSPTQTPHTSHHTYTFSFFQRHISLLHDSVISCSTTNGLLTFPLGESQKPFPEVTLCPLSIDFLSILPFLLLSSSLHIVQHSLLLAKAKEMKEQFLYHFFLKWKNGAGCARGYLLGSISKQGNRGSKQPHQSSWECSLPPQLIDSMVPCGFSLQLSWLG